MAEFQEVMRQWKRMCDAYTTDDADCCSDCPVGDLHEHGCGAIFEMEDTTDWQEYANAIMEWAAENPEPVYPTWEEWLVSNGVMEPDNVRLNGAYRFYYNGKPIENILSPKIFEPIPANIAQKLDIKPLPIVNGDCGSTNRKDAINNLGIKLKEHQ